MDSNNWQLTPQSGFLFQPQPLHHLVADDSPLTSASCDALNTAAQQLPRWIDARNQSSLYAYLQAVGEDSIDFDNLSTPITEHLFKLYGYFASAWVHGFDNKTIPKVIAQPFVRLAATVQRPPMLSYAGQVLSNWQMKDPDAGFTPKNLALLQTFTNLVDEAWFFRVHMAIEGQAGAMLHALSQVNMAIDVEDDHAVLDVLRTLQRGIVQITKTFHHMPELCDPDIYYQDVRPYLMSFDEDVIFEGVADNPAPLRGGSGAQSSIVPALIAGLNIEHETTELIHSLNDMRRYMPAEHRAFIQQMRSIRLRDYCSTRPHLADAYNHVLRNLITFRRAHLYYARTYIFEKSTNPVGTGGTAYMAFLSKLIDETANYFL